MLTNSLLCESTKLKISIRKISYFKFNIHYNFITPHKINATFYLIWLEAYDRFFGSLITIILRFVQILSHS